MSYPNMKRKTELIGLERASKLMKFYWSRHQNYDEVLKVDPDISSRDGDFYGDLD